MIKKLRQHKFVAAILFVFAALFIAAGPFPILNGVLQGDFNVSAYRLYNLGGLRYAIASTGEIWLTSHPVTTITGVTQFITGVNGSGARTDPYDASTVANTNAIFSALAPYTKVHLLDGTFPIDPLKTWNVQKGCVIEGLGDITVVQHQGTMAGSGGPTLFSSGIYEDNNGGTDTVYRNMKLDCNWAGLATTAPIGAGAITVADGMTSSGSPVLSFPVTTVSSTTTSTASSIAVGSTTNFATSGVINVHSAYGYETISYATKDSTHFLGCSGGTGYALSAGSQITKTRLTMASAFARTVSASGVPNTPTTTIGSASNTIALPQATINVASTSSFASTGTIMVATSASASQIVTYTGKTSTTFTGCKGGTGTMTTGNLVSSPTTVLRVPATNITGDVSWTNGIGTALSGTYTIPVTSTTDFASSGMLIVESTATKFNFVAYTGKTSTTFTGCTGGSGNLLTDGTITTQHQLVMTNNATATATGVSVVLGGERATTCNALQIRGSNILVENLHVVGGYGSGANNLEEFCIFVGGPIREAPHVEPPLRTGGSNVVRFNLVEQYLGTYGNPIFFGNGPGRVYGNRCLGIYSGIAEGLTSGGINLAYIDNVDVYDNYFQDTYCIAYLDTGWCHNLRVFNNDSVRGSRGVGIVVANSGTQVFNNRINLSGKIDGGHTYGIDLASATNAFIHDNEITRDTNGLCYPQWHDFSLTSPTTSTIINNRTTNGNDPDAVTSATNCVLYGNRNSDGSMYNYGAATTNDNDDVQVFNITGSPPESVVRPQTKLAVLNVTGSLTATVYVRAPNHALFNEFKITDPRRGITGGGGISIVVLRDAADAQINGDFSGSGAASFAGAGGGIRVSSNYVDGILAYRTPEGTNDGGASVISTVQGGSFPASPADFDLWVGGPFGGTTARKIRWTSYSHDQGYGGYLKRDYSSGSINTFGTRDGGTDTDVFTMKGGSMAVGSATVPSAAGNMAIGGLTASKQMRTDANKQVVSGLIEKKYLQLAMPHRFDGTGAVQQSSDTTQTYFGQARFSNSAAASGNWVEYRVMVPEDIDTTVDLRAKLAFQLSGADTGTHRYVISMASVANSAAYAATLSNVVNMDFAGDASGASGDVETVGWTTLTSWRTSLTAGQLMVIRLARDGATSDTSTVDSYSGPLEIEYGATQ